MLKLFVLFSLLFALSAQAQQAEGLVVIFKEGKSSFANKSSSAFTKKKQIASAINAYKITLPAVFNKSGLDHMAKRLKMDPNVKYVMKNVLLKQRGSEFTPNDTEWTNPASWSFKELSETNQATNAIKAWRTFGTPDKTKLGEEVVVAVVDQGVDVNHPDLKGNIFVNKAEIPGDGIDNDGNGYVDDINGYDFSNDSGEISPGSHGTHVAGTISAVGNNGQGVIGMSPNTKVLSAGGRMTVATALEAYNYVYNLKKTYLETKGTRGANIVATNSSFGYDKADCASTDFIAFNEMFDKLGSVGILNAAATINDELDIEVVGDVPTGCDSAYMLAVTNISPDGELDYAAYGLKSIDIAAPGAEIVSTIPGGFYRNMSGTSMATPHVAGTIAYLHAVASLKFATINKQDPAKGALLIRDFILDSVNKTEYLSTKVKTGGSLDVFKAAFKISNM